MNEGKSDASSQEYMEDKYPKEPVLAREQMVVHIGSA